MGAGTHEVLRNLWVSRRYRKRWKGLGIRTRNWPPRRIVMTRGGKTTEKFNRQLNLPTYLLKSQSGLFLENSSGATSGRTEQTHFILGTMRNWGW